MCVRNYIATMHTHTRAYTITHTHARGLTHGVAVAYTGALRSSAGEQLGAQLPPEEPFRHL